MKTNIHNGLAVAALLALAAQNANAWPTIFQGNAATETAWRAAAGGNVPLENFESFNGICCPCSGQSDPVITLPALGVNLRGLARGSYPGVYVNSGQAHSGQAQLANFGYDQDCVNFLDYFIEAMPGRVIKSAGLWQCDPQGHLTIVAENAQGQAMFSFVALINNGDGDSFAGFVSNEPVARLRVIGAEGDGWNHLDDLQIVTVSICPADIAPPGGNGQVNVGDLLAIINSWGPCANCAACAADINHDCNVNVSDLLAVITAWGPCPQ